MIGMLINLLLAVVWLMLWGTGVMTLSEVTPALAISGVGFFGCFAMTAATR